MLGIKSDLSVNSQKYDFNEFGIKPLSLNSGKYGFQEIKQTYLGYCYAYTGFNLLQRSNYFETLIQTSMREVPGGREVTVPFGDKNGKTIKVSQEELRKEYDHILYEETEDGNTITQEKEWIATSDSSIGMKILEIAFIKQYILEHDNLNDKRAHYEENRKKYHDAIENAKNEFSQKGDFELNGTLLGAVEGGRTSEWIQHMLGLESITSKYIRNNKEKDLLFPLTNNGLLKIMLDPIKGDEGSERKWVKTISGENFELLTDHAYALERTYIDTNTGAKVAVLTNPHDTSEKILMKWEDCIEEFGLWDIAYIDQNQLFRD